jgi:hypothetical protein
MERKPEREGGKEMRTERKARESKRQSDACRARAGEGEDESSE